MHIRKDYLKDKNKTQILEVICEKKNFSPSMLIMLKHFNACFVVPCCNYHNSRVRDRSFVFCM